MRLRELQIKNFRKISELTINFPRGLSVIVGENNVGKTAVIDALRLLLFSSRDFETLRLNEDDFKNGSDYLPIEVSCTFCDLKEEDEVNFQECLIDLGDGKFEIRFNARVEFNKHSRRSSVKMWGGETEGGMLPSKVYDFISSIYLRPLRDPESGLRPGRNSQVSRLIDSITEESDYEKFEGIAKNANEAIQKLEQVVAAKKDINDQMLLIAGKELSQETELIFTDPTFHRIIAGLQPRVDELPFSLNGLGYNNLIFTSATLGTLRRGDNYAYRSILIEEPEAHLHPHLQVLLLDYLAQVSAQNSGNDVQVIASSHSPILASQAPIDSVVSMFETNGEIRVVSMCSLAIDEGLKKKLQRFLDATRGELFFAKRILMVEGISEALIIPLLAKHLGISLKKGAVTVLNVDGLNFNTFLPLFGDKRITVPIAILTDGDCKSLGAELSNTTKTLKANELHINNLRVEYSEITFEHELARAPTMLALMLTAFEMIHPLNGKQLRSDIALLSGNDQKANKFLEEFLRNNTSKGEFAQELAALLDAPTLKVPVAEIPAYIKRALEFLGAT